MTDQEPPVSAENPELHHYTDRAGLEGIWESGVLFATRYDFLNDSTEIGHLRDDLLRVVQDRIRVELLQRRRTDPKIDRLLTKEGLLNVVRHEAENVVSVLYKATFEGVSRARGMAVPYITSFCSHRNDHKYEQENGLLSQWRGYGRDERYAIVFQTDKLEKLLKEEAKEFVYPALIVGNVAYNDEKLNFAERYVTLIDLVAGLWKTFVETGDTKPGDLFVPFLMASTLMKHRAFSEEREVRFVACPTFREADEEMHLAAKISMRPGIRHKEPYCRKRADGTRVEYIRLFGNGKRLPIKRIVVGPHRDQQRLKQQIDTLIEGKVRVVLSQTPFTG
jgi:hypothetical protein